MVRITVRGSLVDRVPDVAAIPIEGRQPDGTIISASLLDAGKDSTEVELLRTVCHGLGVRWGHDEFGWWAVVPSQLEDAARPA
jgi:hypothetical protein